jgi:hypothetical protein
MTYNAIEQILVTPIDKNPQVQRRDVGLPCRYCGESDIGKFRQKAHAITEKLGNNVFISGDECDECNGHISKHENELVNFFGSSRTILGIPNKNKKPTSSDAKGKLRRKGGQISMVTSKMPIAEMKRSADGGGRIVMKLPSVKYRPYQAFLALQKCGIALLKREKLERYGRLVSAILNRREIPSHLMRVSFASNNEGSTMFAAILHERSDDNPVDSNVRNPKHVFSLFVGESCLSVPLLDDTTMQHQVDSCTLNLKTSLRFPNGRLDYHKIEDLDWSSRNLIASRFDQIAINVTPRV